MKALSVQEMKAAEQAAVEQGIGYLQLMENAGAACARAITEDTAVLNRVVTILVGSGNNGGDGLVIARLLDQRGADVKVVFCKGLPKTEEAKTMCARLPVSVEQIQAQENMLAMMNAIDEAEILVDCIFGTGFAGEPNELFCRIFDLANRKKARRFSVDIPSGINGDTGAHGQAYFHPDVTLALGAYKLAHLPEKAGALCGTIRLLDIGIPKNAIVVVEEVTADAAKLMLPARRPNTHKGSYGRLLIIAGSVGMGGAAMMCTKAALRSGSGITVLAAPKSVIQTVAPQMMEAMTVPLSETAQGCIAWEALPALEREVKRATAVVIGCGLGQEQETGELLAALLPQLEVPVLLDADGLNLLCAHKEVLRQCQAPLVLTPHPGELARLLALDTADVVAHTAKACRYAAQHFGAVTVLKGHRSLTGTPMGALFQNTTGNAGMAKGGSGDVLSGIIGALLAQRFDPAAAAKLGVYLHGLAGDLCAETMSQYSMLAGDLIEMLPRAFLQTEQTPMESQEQAVFAEKKSVNPKVEELLKRM